MLRATPALHKLASTKGGMRRILKKRLPVQRYIELAVKAGSYKTPSTRPHYLGLHDVPEPKGQLSPREREERLKLRRGIIDYPTEYEILSLNPPLPTPPRTPVRIRKKIIADKRRYLQKRNKDRRRQGLPDEADAAPVLPTMDRLVQSYLRRHDDRIKAGVRPTDARREEEYYSSLLLGPNADAERERQREKFLKFTNPSALTTAMGRKALVVENAYAFALKQQQVLLDGGGDGKEGKAMTEEESVERVEALLREEARTNRRKGRRTADEAAGWRAAQGDDNGAAEGEKKDDDDDDQSTLPSILHDRPRAIRALNVWSARLHSIPYNRWTIGAATALDHWIAREVLQMDEHTWRQVLEGGGTDAYRAGVDDLPGGETRRGLMDRMRDIVVVRGALFPETLGEGAGADDDDIDEVRGLAGDLDDALKSDETNATERSIDELLASLGSDADDDEFSFRFDDDDEEKKDGEDDDEEEKDVGAEEERLASIMDELQVWRQRHASSPYEAWDVDRKEEFDKWIGNYVATLYPEADSDAIDKEATRVSLLSERPVDIAKTKEFWSDVRTETGAEAFLRDYRAGAQETLLSLLEKADPTAEEQATMAELDAVLAVPYEAQLRKLVGMGTLRPLLDEYAPGSERAAFFEKYTPLFLEGLEMEHLVADPDGPIGLEDLGQDLREELSKEWTPDGGLDGVSATEPRFAVRMVAYGTDEYGTPRSERARELYRLWNEHKANRARFEESMFKRGRLGLEEDGNPRFRRKEKKDPKVKK